MLVVEPLTLSPENTQTSAVAEDLPLYDPGATYERGDRVVYEWHIYEAVKDGKLSLPTLEKEVPDWLKFGAINPYRLIDEFIETQTTAVGQLVIEVEPSGLFDVISLLNVSAATARLLILDADEVWWDVTQSMVDTTVSDWWEYYFTDPVPQRDHIFTNFPATRISRIEITLDAGEAGQDLEVGIGKLIVGRAREIGCAKWGGQISLINLSKVILDEFGRLTIIPRGSRKESNFDVRIDTDKATEVFDTLARIKDTPCLWVGEEKYGITTTYGIYKDYRTILNNRRFSTGVLYIQGML